MTILGFSTSTDHSSVALYTHGKVARPLSWTRKDQQSEALTGYIKKYLRKNHILFNQLSLIAVDSGPGSFTGARIAVNIAKTLSFDLNVPLLATSSLEIMACGMAETLIDQRPYTIFSVLDAHRSLFYFQKYQTKNSREFSACSEIQALSLEEIAREAPSTDILYILGNLKAESFAYLKGNMRRLRPSLNVIIPKAKKNHFPRAEVLVALANSRKSSDQKSWAEVEPMYIRAPDAVEKLKVLK